MMVAQTTSAPSAGETTWKAILWQKAEAHVKQLQIRIAKATHAKQYGKVKALQWLLTHSYYAKLIAVKRVTDNVGARTAGIDNILWRTDKQKYEAVKTLQRHTYKAQALRRIYIPKKDGKKRPLSIPTMKDRAMQALYLLALEPVAEVTADANSYGFRPKRAAADAIEQCFKILVHTQAASWILEADIKSCFDHIHHPWLLTHILIDKKMLQQWLKAGYMENHQHFSTAEGTPQGGIISPCLMNMTLDGLEVLLKKQFAKHQKVHFVRYADDFIITGCSKELLEHKVKPIVEHFLQERGLELSRNKTKITPIEEGFDFLGFHCRKYKGKLKIKPAKKNVHTFLKTIRREIKRLIATSAEIVIRTLNPKIRGWANYYRTVASKEVMSYVDYHIFYAIFRWIQRKHPHKNVKWQREKYFRQHQTRQWIFHSKVKNTAGGGNILDLERASNIKVVKHIKIRSEAHPYDPKFDEYFEQRKKLQKLSKLRVFGWAPAKPPRKMCETGY